MPRQAYRKRKDQAVTAVQLALEFDGFSFQKWGNRQTCKAGDWLVNNNGDIYTISDRSFLATYERVSPGRYRKIGSVWAEVAIASGTVKTQEGATEYVEGDYLVSNNEDGTDAYAVSKQNFETMYERVGIEQ